MEDNLFNKIRESEELYGHVEMPTKALQDYKNYASSKASVNGKSSKRLFWGLLAALLLTNGFWLFKTWNSSDSNTSPKVSTLQVSKDTIYITKEVYLSDSDQSRLDISEELKTLKNDLKQQRFKFNQDRVQLSTIIKDLNSTIASTASLGRNSLLSPNGIASNRKIQTAETDNPISRLKDRSTINSIGTLKSLENSLIDYEEDKMLIPLPPIIIRLNDKMSIVEFLKPKSFTLLASTGIVGQTSNRYSPLSGNQFGFGFTSLMSNHWRYNINFDYFKLKGEYKDGDVLPNIATPSAPPGSTLDEVYVSQSGWQGSFGVDFLFKPIKVIRPFAGIYYQNRSSNFNNILFKFKKDGSEELELSSPNTPRFNQNIIGLRAGLDINIWQSVDGFIGINYNHNFSTLENSLLSLNTGMYYHF